MHLEELHQEENYDFAGKDIEIQKDLLEDLSEEDIAEAIKEDGASFREYINKHPEIVKEDYVNDPKGTVDRLKEIGFYHHNKNNNGETIH